MDCTDVVGLLNTSDSFRSSFGVRYSRSSDRCRVFVCDVRCRVLVSVTSKNVLDLVVVVVVVVVENVV